MTWAVVGQHSLCDMMFSWTWQVDLSKVSIFIIVVSTTGNGDPPDNAQMFWRHIRRPAQPKDYLANVYFAVLGLGDSNYTKFWWVVWSGPSRALSVTRCRPPCAATQARRFTSVCWSSGRRASST